MTFSFLINRRAVRFGALLIATLACGAVQAQVQSQGRGVLTLLVGQGSSPVGAIAAEVATQTSLPKITQHSIGWRVSGGYNFADYFAFEAAIARVGYAKKSAPYQPSSTFSDQINAQTALNVIEANLIGRLPVSDAFRFNFTAGVAETSLDTTLSTQSGSALPIDQENPVHARRFGFDVGADAEWKLSEHLSAIAGYHVYPNAGSQSTIGSAYGTFSLIGAGLHIEF